MAKDMEKQFLIPGIGITRKDLAEVLTRAQFGLSDESAERYVSKLTDDQMMFLANEVSIHYFNQYAEDTLEWIGDLLANAYSTLNDRREVGLPPLWTGKITYEGTRQGNYLVKDHDTGKDILFQVDYEYPDLAKTFGWSGRLVSAAELKRVNIKPEDTTGAEIYSAIQYLDEHEGKTVEDLGYFDTRRPGE